MCKERDLEGWIEILSSDMMEFRLHSFVAWLTQPFLAIVVPMLLAGFTAGSIAQNLAEWPGFPLGIVGEVIWYAIFVWGIGLFLGLIVYRLYLTCLGFLYQR
jgi:hypothetical protein